MKYTLLIVLVIIIVACGATYLYLHNLGPKYAGEIRLSGLRAKVEILFDTYAIPHIYGQNEEDVYFALGYVQAQERLFQMEMLRRVAAGRLAEILGKDLLKTDRLFRTLGIAQTAQRSADLFFKANAEPFQKATHAYLRGINQFLARGKTPIEFTILGIPKEEFTPRDIYLAGMFISFGFAAGFQMDPLTDKAYRRLGWKYLQDWAIDWPPGAQKIPVQRRPASASIPGWGVTINRILARLPVATWIGSNGWVVSPAKSKTGQVIFANDTHMAYSQPSVWYEAHLEYPGFSFYGNHAAGIPFGLVGHNRFAAWGLTMFENDDVDFYREKVNPQNPNQVWVDDHWEDLQIRQEIIKVKGAADVVMQVRSSRHGPIINDVDETVAATETVPVAVWWSATKFPLTTIQAFYMLAHADRFAVARKAASLINAPGLNVMYGDRDGNIAWWAASKLVKRPPHVNSKLFLDGAGGKDEPLGWYDFAENPQSENPPSGFVYSANNQPERMGAVLYPGYYVPEDRARRILEYLQTDKKWTVANMQKMNTDSTCAVKPSVAREIAKLIASDVAARKSPVHQKALRMLKTWDGNHRRGDVGPVIYYKLLYYIYENAMVDELGPDDFQAFISTHLMKRTTAVFVPNDNSLWWDDIRTTDVKETRRLIFVKSFAQTIGDLIEQFGDDTAQWQWGKVHTLEHGHVLGMKKPLDKIFNVGPFPAMGGNEVINNLGFKLNRSGQYKVYFGPAMRRIIDFADIENSISVNPTGQSGYFMSPHYDDQAVLFNTGKFRKQMMNRQEIEQNQIGRLILKPA